MHLHGYHTYCKEHPESFWYSPTLCKYMLRKDATKEAKRVYKAHQRWLKDRPGYDYDIRDRSTNDMLLGFYEYFEERPESYKFDNDKRDYVLLDGATEKAKRVYKEYKDLEKWAYLEGVIF